MENKFIVFEGPDGSGKDTQVEILKENLLAKGIDVVVLNNISNAPIGKAIRETLGMENGFFNTQQAACAYISDLYNTDREIQRLLKEGKTVICNRWLISTFIYGSDFTEQGFRFVAEGYKDIVSKPDVIFHLNINDKVTLDRVDKRAEVEGKEYFEANPERVKKYTQRYGMFAKLMEKCENYKIIEASESINMVSFDIEVELGTLGKGEVFFPIADTLKNDVTNEDNVKRRIIREILL